MKKIIAGLFTAAALTAGAVAVSGAPADAAGTYPGNVNVVSHVSAPSHIAPHQSATVKVSFNLAGAKAPKGRVIFLVRRGAEGTIVARSTHAFSKHLTFTTPRLHRGHLQLIVKFVSPKGTVYHGAYRRLNLRVS